MQIKEIYIQNFKGFEKKNFSFNPNFNVAIGNNATGKSTLLHSIQVALGGYLQCLDIPASRNYRRQFKDGEAYVRWNELERGYLKNLDQTLITTTAKFSHVSSDTPWTRVMLKNNTTSHNQRNAGELMAVVEQLLRQKTNAQIPMPIVASFGTERTVAQLRKGKKAQSRRTQREKAFLAALSEKVDFDGVIEWLHNYDKELEYKKEFPGTKNAVFNAIQTAIPYLKNVEYNNYYQEFEAEITVDLHAIGKTLHSNMSDGLKAMLNLVAELAFRCVILNGYKGANAVVETEGVVLIDELDMHLHPIWQKHVVEDLKAAFPKLQFIVTTHSPFIVQSVNAEELINLDVQTTINPKDYPIEVISEEVMNVDGSYGTEKSEQESLSVNYFNLLTEAEASHNKDDYKIRLEQLENSITDTGLRAYLKTHRIAKNII
jgi:predicted ATP-binding protein involved in virulence